jgi:hypothetical protein
MKLLLSLLLEERQEALLVRVAMAVVEEGVAEVTPLLKFQMVEMVILEAAGVVDVIS